MIPWQDKLVSNGLSAAQVIGVSGALQVVYTKVEGDKTIEESERAALRRLLGPSAKRLDGLTQALDFVWKRRARKRTPKPEGAAPDRSEKEVLRSAWGLLHDEMRVATRREKAEARGGAMRALYAAVFEAKRPLGFLLGDRFSVLMLASERLTMLRAASAVAVLKTYDLIWVFKRVEVAQTGFGRSIGTTGSIAPVAEPMPVKETLMACTEALCDFVQRAHSFADPHEKGSEQLVARLLAPLAEVPRSPVRRAVKKAVDQAETPKAETPKVEKPKAEKPKVSAPNSAEAARFSARPAPVANESETIAKAV